jgi:hypothetical protein
MRGSSLTAVALAAALLPVGITPVFAQTATPPTPPPAQALDPAQQKAQAAFEALPEAERRQIQLDLTFAVAFSGAALGTFGPLTYRGIQAFERANRSTVDGILEAPERAALAAAAKAERDRLGFRTVVEPVSKAAIGLPMTLLPKAEPQAAGGPRWQTADGKATVALRAPKPEEGTLEQLYEKALVSSNPERRVTYRLLRPDFFVLAGETPQGKFYQRLTKLPDGALRGFSISYDKALAPVWDKMTVAAANTYLPAGLAAAAANRGPTAPPQPPRPPAAEPLAPRAFQPALTAVIVAPGRALTAMAPLKACAQPRVGGVSARLVAEDAGSGLALIAVEGSTAPAIAASLATATTTGADVGVIAFGAGTDGTRTLLALPGNLAGASLSAPLQPGAAGAPLFGASGLSGIVISDPSARFQVAGVVLSARHGVAAGAAVERFLKGQGITLAAGVAPGTADTLGSMVARHGRSVVGLTCG